MGEHQRVTESFNSDGEASASGEAEEVLIGVELLMRPYVSKDDIIEAVTKCHDQVMRPYRVAKSDKRRYKAVCPVERCAFFAQFAFAPSFDRSPRVSRHTCGPEVAVNAVKRLSIAKNLAKNTELREYFLQIDQKRVAPIMIQRKAQKLGLPTSYMNCVNTFKRLVEEFYGDDRSQYPRLPSYIEALTKRGHKACYEVVGGIFVCLAVVYREGIQAFSQYNDRGLSIKGTFLKTAVGGALLIACFRNGNLQL